MLHMLLLTPSHYLHMGQRTCDVALQKTPNPISVLLQLWAYANVNASPGEPMLEAMTARAQAELRTYSAQNISNMLWAFAKFSYRPEAFLAIAMDFTVNNLTEFSAQSTVSS